MKVALLLLVASISLTLYAKPAAKWAEKPVSKAKLFELQGQGLSPIPVNPVWSPTHELVMFKVRERASAFEFKTVTPGPVIACIKAPCVQPSAAIELVRFEVVKKGRSDCGSVKYTAQQSPRKGGEMIEVIDHSNRICDDYKPYKWEVTRWNRFGKRKPLYFGGDPVPVGKDCAQYGNGICNMLYAPVLCKAMSYEGSPLNPPIAVDASNACHSVNQIKIAACERGLDPENFVDSDILCMHYPPPPVVFEPPCPVASCMAPPEGCVVVPDNTRNERGCLVNPCGHHLCSADGEN